MPTTITSLVTTDPEIIAEFRIAENYFSDILNAQLVIFSLVVAIIVALYFLFNWKISKEQIKNEVEESTKKIEEKFTKEFEKKSKLISENLASELVKHENMITSLRGEVYRTLGQFWDSEKQYNTAFIWWIRSAHNLALAGEENITRIALGSAKESVEKIKFGFELNYDLIGEYQRLFAEVDDKIYKIEKELLDKAIKDALNRKLKTDTSN